MGLCMICMNGSGVEESGEWRGVEASEHVGTKEREEGILLMFRIDALMRPILSTLSVFILLSVNALGCFHDRFVSTLFDFRSFWCGVSVQVIGSLALAAFSGRGSGTGGCWFFGFGGNVGCSRRWLG